MKSGAAGRCLVHQHPCPNKVTRKQNEPGCGSAPHCPEHGREGRWITVSSQLAWSIDQNSRPARATSETCLQKSNVKRKTERRKGGDVRRGKKQETDA